MRHFIAFLSLAAVTACQTATPSGGATIAASTNSSGTSSMPPSDGPAVAAESMEKAGEYLVLVASCNDCHTQNWAESQGNVPVSERFQGNDLGYRGAWGTSYGKNLRSVVQRHDENDWVEIMRTADKGDGKPPMPWWDTKHYSERDLRAMYRYIKSLGPSTKGVPRAVPAGREPTGRFVWLTPQMPKTGR